MRIGDQRAFLGKRPEDLTLGNLIYMEENGMELPVEFQPIFEQLQKEIKRTIPKIKSPVLDDLPEYIKRLGYTIQSSSNAMDTLQTISVTQKPKEWKTITFWLIALTLVATVVGCFV